jgi:hypothetical protein
MRVENSEIPLITHTDTLPINDHRKYRVCTNILATFLLPQYVAVYVYALSWFYISGHVPEHVGGFQQ